MKRKRCSEEQTIALKEHEAGLKTTDLCRKHGISEATFYSWETVSMADLRCRRRSGYGHSS